MDVNFKKQMCDSTRVEVQNGIEDAQAGELSPHWQEYLRRTVRDARNGGYLPDDMDQLLTQLENVLATVPQMSDEELDRKQLAQSGTELIYNYPTDDYDTIVMITYHPESKLYSATVSLDPDAAKANLKEYAKNVEQAVWTWLREQKVDLQAEDIPAIPPENALEHFEALKETLQYVIARLKSPELLI